MPAKIHLNDGSTFIVDEPLEAVESAYQEAIDLKGVLRIKNGNGKVHVVNPVQVSYIEGITAELEAHQEEQAAPSAQAR